jgi:hypothetical protein
MYTIGHSGGNFVDGGATTFSEFVGTSVGATVPVQLVHEIERCVGLLARKLGHVSGAFQVERKRTRIDRF